MEINVEYLQLKHPATILVGGPTGCGNTMFVRRVIQNHKLLFNVKNEYNIFKVLWCYGQWQDNYNKPISETSNINYMEGFPDVNDVKEYAPHLIVIDDLMNE